MHTPYDSSLLPYLLPFVFTSITNQLTTLWLRLCSSLSLSPPGVAGFNARSNSANCAYVPFFPASSPYVLAVGATQGLEQSNKYERACSAATGGLITSGGR